ncbi:hypothetical protein BGX24_005126 [Mortierella sp. AD032]|nr:hypothetical protein BGX24_005126 [Mortierella sp. AD032]
MARRVPSLEHAKETCSTIVQNADDLPCSKTNHHDDQQHYCDNDLDINERSSGETDFDEERGHAHKVITNSSSAPHRSDTTGTVIKSLARDASSSIVDLSPTKSNVSIYNHPSSHEFPNGNVVEAIQLPSDQDFPSKSTGWALLPLQSFKALVRKNCDVKVYPHAGILKAQSCTSQKLRSLKKKKLDSHVVSDNKERVDIAEKICFGVYK